MSNSRVAPRRPFRRLHRRPRAVALLTALALALSMLSAVSVATVATAPAAAAAAAASTNCTPDAGYTSCAAFSYSGSMDSFTVPANVTSLKVKAWGAGGGGVDSNFSTVQAGGGGGGYATALMAVTSGQTVSVAVGQGGRSGVNGSLSGAFGNGGAGGSHTTTGSTSSDGGSGGGYSVVANNTDFSSANTILVAAGGGGAGPSTMTGTPDAGGGGGAVGGQSTVPASTGRGGSDGVGGAAATNSTNCTAATAGAKLQGGRGGSVAGTTSSTPNAGGGGGGAGWFGGGGGRCGKAVSGATPADQAGSGGGGQSFTGATGLSNGSTAAGTNGVAGSPGRAGAAGNNADQQYVAGVGVGGGVTVAGGGNGGNGLVVLEWNVGYTVANAASALTVSPGGSLVYQVTVTNTSPNAYTAGSPLGFSDNLTDVLDDAVYNGDASSSVAGWTFSGSTTLVASGPLAAGASATISFSVTARTSGTGNKSLVSVVAPAGAAGSCGASCSSSVPVGSPSTSCPVSASLPNGSFEAPVVAAGPGRMVNGGDASLIWRTTASDNKVEMWANGGNVQAQNGNIPITGQSGTQWVEINANVAGALYQDISTRSGEVLQWSVWHRARGLGGNNTTGQDVMQVQIGTTTNQTAQVPNGQSGVDISDGPLAWVNYTGLYTVPSGQTTTRFQFAAISTASGSIGYGNFIDNLTLGDSPCFTATTTSQNQTAGAGGLTRPGDTVQYTVSATNNGGSASGATVISSAVPAGTSYVPGSLTIAGVPVSDSTGDDTGDVTGSTVNARVGTGATASAGGAVAIGASVSYTFKVKVNAAVAAGTVVSGSASVSYTWPPSTTANTTQATAANNLISSTALSLVKSVDNTVDTNGNGVVDAGDRINYLFKITNTGSVTLTGLAVSDSKAGGVSCPATSASAGGVVVCTASYTVTSSDSSVGSITNTATATGTPPSGASAVTSAPSSVTTPVYFPALTVSMSSSTASFAAVGDNLVFTTVVTNGGNSTLTNVNVVPALTAPAGSFSSSACSVNQPVTLAPGASYNCTSAYAARQTDIDNGRIGATASAVGTPPQGSNVTAAGSASSTATQSPALSASAAATPTRVTAAGQTVTFSFAVSNTGNVTLSGISLTDVLTAPATPVPTFSCAATTLAPGVTTTCSSAAYTVTSADISAGQIVNTGTAKATSAGGAAVSSSSSAVTVVAAPPVITFSPGPGEVGVAYSQQPTISGGDGPFSWSLTGGSLPGGVTLNASTGAISGTPTSSGNFSVTLTATDSKGVVATKSATFTIAPLPIISSNSPAAPQVGIAYSKTYTVSGGTAPVSWSMSAGGPSAGLPPGLTLNSSTGVLSGTPTRTGTFDFVVQAVDANNKSATRQDSLSPTAGPIVITKTADVASTVAGGTVNYTITVANSSSSAFSGVSLTDPLTSVLDDAAYNADLAATGGTASYAASTVSWTGDLAANATIRITYSVKVNSSGNGDRSLVNSVSSSTVGANCGSGNTDTRCSTTVPVAGLSISKTAGAPTTTPGGTVSYTIVVTNTGQTTYTGATFTENLTDVLDDATYNTNASATTGSVSFSSPSLTWTGNLAVGASATITYTVTVANPDSGNKTLAATVVSSTAGNNCQSGGPAASCSATVQVLVPSLTITNVAAPVLPVLLGHWTFDEGSGSTAADTGGSHAATLTGGAGWTAGTQGASALSLNGGSGYADTGAAVLNTSQSFSVSAWVKLNALGGYRTFVSQDANAVSAFYLQLRGDTGRFAFTRLPIDDTNSATVTASATAAPVAGQWYHLTGVYDATAGTSALYVNGVLQQRVSSPSVINGTGNLVIGRGKFGGPVDFANAAIDDVQAYRGVLYPATATTVPGATVPLTTVISNSGQTAYGNTTVVLNLSAAVDDAVYDNDATASSGTLAYNSAAGTLTWTGTLPIGTIVTVNSTMTVRNPDPGDKNVVTAATSSAAGSSCPTGGSTAGCTASVAVRVPALTIAKTADVTSTTPGSTVNYTITVTNTGQTDYQGATFVDGLAGVLDDTGPPTAITASAGTAGFSSPNLTWTGNLAIGASATIKYSVVVNNPDNGDRTLSGAITSSTPGNICSGGDARCSNTVAVLLPGLTITNVAAPVSPVLVGHWTFDEGSGTTAADTGGSHPAALTGTAGWGVGTQGPSALALNGTNGYADAGAAVLDTSGSFTVSAVVKLNNVNGYQTFVSQDGSQTSPFYLQYRTDSGRFTFLTLSSDCSCGQETRAVGLTAPVVGQWYRLTGVYDATRATASLYVDGVLQQRVAATGLWQATGSTVIGRAKYQGNLNDYVNGSIDDVQIYRGVLFPAPATTVPGATVPLTTVISNSGQTAYGSTSVVVNLSAAVDDAVYDNDATASAGSVTYNASAGTLTWTGSLALGAVVTVSSTMTVRKPQAGDKSLVTTAGSTAAGSSCPQGSQNAGCTATLQVLLPALAITQTANTSTVVTGGVVNYTVVVQNTGESAYANASFTDSLSTVLPDAIYSGGATASVGTVSYSAPVLTWSGPLAVGASATITFSVTVRDPDPGNKRLLNTVTSTTDGSNCPSGGTDTRCTSDVAVLVPALTLVKTANQASTVPGAVVSYTVTVTNSGQTAYTGAAFADAMTGVLDDATYNADVGATAGTASGGSSGISWTGNLAVGASATITYSVTVKAADGGDNLLTNTVVSTTKGNNCGAGSTDSRCSTSVPVARLLIVQGSAPATTTPGSAVTLTVTFTNTGRVPYTGITVQGLGAALLDDVSINGDATATSGSLQTSSTSLSWTGNIAVGASVTVSAGFIVNDPDTGDRLITSTWQSSAPGNNCPAGSSDSRCTVTLRVLIPALAIAVTSDATQVTPGDTVHYTVTAQNTGQTAYSGASLAIALSRVIDDATYGNDGAATSGQVTFSSSTLSWTGDLAVNGTVTITYSATVRNPDPGDKTLGTAVTSSAPGSSCTTGGSGPSCSNTVSVLTPGLTIVKSVTPSAVTLGGLVQFTVVVTNTGQTPYSAASFADNLTGTGDDATYNFDEQATSGSVGVQTPSVVWTGSLAVGARATITYSFRVNNPGTGDRLLTSTLVSTTVGSNCPSGGTDSRCSTATPVTNAPTLTLKQVADTATTASRATVRFTDTVTNNSTAAVNATFTDSLAGILDDAAYVGSAASAGTLNYSAPNLTWTGALAAGATVTVTYDVTVGTSAVGNDSLLIGRITSSSAPGSNNCPVDGGATMCSTTVPVARIQLQQYAAETTSTPGSAIHLTQVYTNTGKVPYSNITVSSPRADTSDDASPTGDQVATSGTIVRTATSVDWTGDVPVGGTVTITRSLVVADPDLGNKRVTATLTSTAPGNNCQSGTTDPLCTFVVTVLVPALTITKTSSVPLAQPGDTVGYTVSIVNTGQVDYSGITVTDSLTGVLDDATFDIDITPAGAVFSGTTVTWSGDLAVGASASFSYSVTVNSPDSGDKLMISAVRSNAPGSTCTPSAPAATCGNLVTVLTPALTIVSTAAVTNSTLGSTVPHTIVVTNTGQTAYSAASFSDDLGGLLDDATLVGSPVLVGPGSVSYSNGVLSWSGSLSPGDTATVTYLVAVRTPSSGDRVMTSRTTSTTRGSNCGAGSVDSRCGTSVALTNSVTLTFTKTADVLYTVAGATVHYTVTVNNASALPVVDAEYTDPLADILDDATYAGDADASSGSVSLHGSNLDWSGTVAAHGTVTVTYSVVVQDPLAGNKMLSGAVYSTSVSGSDNCLADSTDPRCASSVPIAQLHIAQNDLGATTTPGTALPFVVTFTNEGTYAYEGITISTPGADVLDDAISTGNQHATSGTLAVTAEAITWTGDIPVGGSVTVSGTAVVANPDTGNRVITTPWESSAPGNNCFPGNSDPVCTTVIRVLVPGLTVGIAASSTTAVPDDTVDYTLTVTNSGETPYTAATVTQTLANVLDDAAIVPTGGVAVTATAGSVSLDGATSVLSWTGDLAPGDIVIISFSVRIKSPDPGDKNMLSSVTSDEIGSNCPTGSTSASCSNSVEVLTPSLSIVTTASVARANLGTVVTYTVTVTNDGQTAYQAAGFTDDLSQTLDDATFGSVSANAVFDPVGSTVTWSAALAVGASATISFTVQVLDPAGGDGTMSSAVTSTDAGNDCPVGGTDSRCVTAVAVIDAPALQFRQSTDVVATVAGGTVQFTDTVTNNSPTTVAGASFTDSLTGIVDDATYVESAASSGSLTVDAASLSWTGDIAAGATVTVTYTVTADSADTGDLLLTGAISSASVPGSNNCAAGSADFACAATVAVARLEIARHTTITTVTPGTVVHLPVTIANTGKVPYVDISVTIPRADTSDDLDAFGNDVATSGTLVRTTTATVWTGDVPVGTTITITIDRIVKNPDTGNKVITAPLISAAPGNNCPADSSDPRCTFSIAVLVPGLTLSTTADVATAQPGDVVHYTVVAHNTGQTSYPAAQFTDDLTNTLDDAGFNNDTAVIGGGQLTVNSTGLSWTGDLDPGDSVTVTFSVTVSTPDPGDKGMVTVLSSPEVGSTCPAGSADAACRTSVVVLTPQLTISSTTDSASSAPGAVVNYSITVSNTGQTDYPAAAVRLDLAGILDDATYRSDAAATSNPSGIDVSGGVLTWSGPLATGQDTTITFSVQVDATDAGDHELTAVVTSATGGTNCSATGSDPRCATDVPIASLRLVNSVDVSTTSPTSVVHFTGTFTNTGQVPYQGISVADSFVGAVDDAVYNGDATATSGDVVIIVGSGRVVWNGDIAVGQTVTITGSVTVRNPDPGDKLISTRLISSAAGNNCSSGSGDVACSTGTTVLIPALTITTAADTSSTTPGSTVHYTVTVANTGQVAYPAATVRALLAGSVEDAAYGLDAAADSPGTFGYTGSTLSWTGAVAVGQTVVITYSMTVFNPDPGDKSLVTQVFSDAVGSSCPSGDGPGCMSVVPVLVPALNISVAADSTSTTPGSLVQYTVTIANTGETAYQGAVVDLDLAGVLDDATLQPGGSATIGALTPQGSVLEWSGNLPTATQAVISYTVMVGDPDPGNHSLGTSVSSAEAGGTCTALVPCVNTVTVLTPGLSVSSAVDLLAPTPGDAVTVTLTLTNTGETDYVGATFTSSLAGMTDDASFDGVVAATTGSAGYDGSTLSWTGNLAVGATAKISYTVTIRNPDTGDKVLTATVVAPDAGSSCRPGSTDPGCTAVVAVRIPVLTITKAAISGSTTTPGSVVTYRITIANTGQTGYAAASVSDSLVGVLADADYNQDAVAGGSGEIAYDDSILTWTGGLEIGETATVTYSVTVLDPDPGDKTIRNAVSSSAPGSTCPPAGTDAGCSSVVRVLIPQLSITQTADVSQVVAGRPVQYTVTIANTGETAYPAATLISSLTGVLDDAGYDADAEVIPGDAGTIIFDAGTSQLRLTGDLAVGATTTLTYSVTTSYPANGDHTLAGSVSLDAPGSSCRTGAEPGCSTVVEILVPVLAITMTTETSAAVAGGNLTYRISAHNAGEADYASATITDSLTALGPDAVYAGDGVAGSGTLTYLDGVLTWTGPVAQGDTVLISFSVHIDVEVDDGTVLSNRVRSQDTGSTCTAADPAPTCSTATGIAARSLLLSLQTPSFTLTGPPGATVSQHGAVVLTVTTNSTSGYAVTVQSTGGDLGPAIAANADSIPVSALGVRETGSGLYQALLTGRPETVHEQSGPSAPGGDAISNDYQVQIPPATTADTYSGTLEYIVSAQ